MALQINITDPNTGEPVAAGYLRAVGIDSDLEHPELTVIKVRVYINASAATGGKAQKYNWRIPLAHLVNGTQDVSDLNAVLGMPVPSLGLAGKAAYNAVQASIYTWLKQSASADRIGFDLSAATDV